MTNPYAILRKKLGRPLFVPFTVLGDPNPSESRIVIKTLIENGADALELGLPFSDPPADGPVIQAADVRALAAGTTVDDCFAIIREICGPKARAENIPVGLLVYFNLVLQRGIEKFYADCAVAGVASVLIADLPLEHAHEVRAAATANGILQIFLVSDVTTDERLDAICKVAEGYLYLVSYLGVTGVSDAVRGGHIQKLVERCRARTELPLIVGFGIQNPADAETVINAGADGVIVGSRIVREIPHLDRIASVTKEFSAVCRQ